MCAGLLVVDGVVGTSGYRAYHSRHRQSWSHTLRPREGGPERTCTRPMAEPHPRAGSLSQRRQCSRRSERCVSGARSEGAAGPAGGCQRAAQGSGSRIKPTTPTPATGIHPAARLNIHRHDRLGGILHDYGHAARAARMTPLASTRPPRARPVKLTPSTVGREAGPARRRPAPEGSSGIRRSQT